MAKQCGWHKDFVFENFTLGQLKLYFEYLNKMEVSEIKSMAIAFRASQMSEEDFKRFLDDGKGQQVNTKASFEKMKELDLPIEEN